MGNISSHRDQYKKEFSDLDRLIGKIHWLEPIDLEVAGEEGENLLAAVLVRISRALDKEVHSGGNQACRQAMGQLEELANDIGIAWDGNLQARASRLDPSSYSQEVMSAQRARLGTNQRLHEALDTLSKQKCYGCRPETLFVLPIDDFYLKPSVSLDLLRLLRMISIPRLFSLIMGEQKNMEALFFEKALADWTDVAGSQIFGSQDERRKSEVLSRAREMSARYFRKLLPVGQRGTIDTLSWSEALKYRPPIKDSCNVLKLSNLLAGITVCTDAGKGISNLLDFLLTQKIGKPYLSDPDDKSSHHTEFLKKYKNYENYYSALQILEAMPREVMDLWMSFRELISKTDPRDSTVPAYLEKVLEMVLIIIEEQNFLDNKKQELLRSSFPTGFDTWWPVQTKNWRFSTPLMRSTISSDKALLLRKHSGWNIHILDEEETGDKNGERRGSFSHLPPRPTSWIILLHDLIWIWNREMITENLVEKLIQRLVAPCKCNTVRNESGWAWYQPQKQGTDEGRNDNWIHFPFPDLQTFRQLDRFLSIWNYFLSKSDIHSLPRSKVVERWIHAAWLATGPDDLYDIEILSRAVGRTRKC